MYNYGFRFFIAASKEGKFAVRDLEDGSVEWLTRGKVLEAAKVVDIAGVNGSIIDVGWFKSYFAKVVLSQPLDVIIKNYNLVVNSGGDICFADYESFGRTDMSPNYPFICFITSCKNYIMKLGSKTLSEESMLPPKLFKQLGVDCSRFRGKDVAIGFVPMYMWGCLDLSGLNCDNVFISFGVLNSDNLCIDEKVWGKWVNKFFGLHISVSCSYLVIKRLEKGIYYNINVENILTISDDVLKYLDSYSIHMTNVARMFQLESNNYTYKLLRLMPLAREQSILHYKVNTRSFDFVIIDCNFYKNYGKQYFEFHLDESCGMFYILNWDDMGDMDFVVSVCNLYYHDLVFEPHGIEFRERHGISWKEFKKRCKVVDGFCSKYVQSLLS